MKAKHLFVVAMLCAPTSILTGYSQGLYLGIGGGYGFPAAKQSMFEDYKTTSTSSGSTTEYTAHPFSLGKGVNAGAYIGFGFNKNTAAELGFSYLIGSATTFTDETNNTVTFSSSKTEETWKGRMIRIIPTLRITGGENKVHPYVKAGLILGVSGKMYTDRKFQSSGGGSGSNTEETWEYSGGMSFGFHGGAGINYMVSDKLGIFAEVTANYQNWAMKKGVMTAYTVDGQDQLSTLDKRDREIEFVDSYSYSSSSPPDVNQADKSTKFYLPFSSIGINLGVHFSLGKSE